MYSKVRDLIRAAFKTIVINIDTAAGKQQFTIVAGQGRAVTSKVTIVWQLGKNSEFDI